MNSTSEPSTTLPQAGAIAPYFVSEAPTLILDPDPDPDPTILEPKETAPRGCQPDEAATPKDITANRPCADVPSSGVFL